MEIINTTGCCDKFDPAPWDGVTHEWDNKLFIKSKVFTLFYMPIGFGSVISKMYNAIKAAGAEVPEKMSLADHTSMWSMDLYLPVNKEVDGADNIKLSGKFFSKAYEGGYKDMKAWIAEFKQSTSNQSMKISKNYYWYTTCPKCAKEYGKNYTVIFGKIES